jgi:hypothetical protein
MELNISLMYFLQTRLGGGWIFTRKTFFSFLSPTFATPRSQSELGRVCLQVSTCRCPPALFPNKSVQLRTNYKSVRKNSLNKLADLKKHSELFRYHLLQTTLIRKFAQSFGKVWPPFINIQKVIFDQIMEGRMIGNVIKIATCVAYIRRVH